MANFVAGPGITGATDYQTQATALDRRQKIIESLLAQQQPQGRMVGDHYIAPSILQHAAAFLGPLAGQHMGKKLDEDRSKNAVAYQTGMQGDLGRLGRPDASGSVPREQILQMLSSQYPEVRSRGEKEMGKLDAMDTPFMRMFGRGMQGGGGAGVPQAMGGVGGAQTFPVGDTPAMPGEAMATPPVAPNPTSGPAPVDQLAQMFPNLTQPEVQQLLATDPSGKQLVEASLKRNAPIVAGNNVFQPQGGGRIGNAPGSVDAMSAVLRAQEAAKAPYGTPIRIETEGGERVLRPDQFVAESGAGGFQLPQAATATNFRIPPAMQQARDGDRLAILQAERAKATSPADIAALDREIAGTRGNAPAAPSAGINSGYGPTQRAERTGLFDADVKQVSEFRTAAQKAGQAVRAINQIENGLKGGSFQGTYANVQERAAAFFGPLGIPVDTKKLTNTQEVKAFVQNLVIPQVKQLGFNPTDADARRIEESVGNIATDPKAMEKIMGVLKADSKQTIEQFKRADAHLRKNRSLEGFDYGFENPTPSAPVPAAPGTMSLADYYAKMKGGR
jgi:hypothetical protein